MSHQYGLGAAQESAQATGAAGATTIAAGAALLHSFSAYMCAARVWNHPASTARLYVKWNASSAASASNYDAVLEPGDGDVAPPGIMVSTVSVFSDAASGKTVTLGTDYTVRGWE